MSLYRHVANKDELLDALVERMYAEAVLATLISAGCSPRLASRAFVVLDSYAYGFAVQEVTMPSTEPHEVITDEFVSTMQPYPSMLAVMGAVMADANYDFGAEFDAGLDLVLDGIDRWRAADSAASP